MDIFNLIFGIIGFVVCLVLGILGVLTGLVFIIVWFIDTVWGKVVHRWEVIQFCEYRDLLRALKEALEEEKSEAPLKEICERLVHLYGKGKK